MSDTKFKRGDRVRCVEEFEGRLTLGEVYKVVGDTSSPFTRVIDDLRSPANWFTSRFELVSTGPKATDFKVGDRVKCGTDYSAWPHSLLGTVCVVDPGCGIRVEYGKRAVGEPRTFYHSEGDSLRFIEKVSEAPVAATFGTLHVGDRVRISHSHPECPGEEATVIGKDRADRSIHWQTPRGCTGWCWEGEETAYSISNLTLIEKTPALEEPAGSSFSVALIDLKAGKRVARAGWNGKGMFLFLVPGSTFNVNRPPLLGIYPEGAEVSYHAHVDMETAQGDVVPWLASQTDLLADDWRVVE